ncbi:MAG: zinc ABC transporter substrate-binding protein [Bacteroidota bacterium]
MRFIVLMLCCWPLLGFSAPDEKPIVVTSASMIADMASKIAGEHLTVECLVPIGGDPHLHEATPSDARQVVAANLLLLNGLTFDGWLNELIDNSGSKATVVTVTEGMEPISSAEGKNSVDPHAWMNVQMAMIYIRNIKNAFQELLPSQKDAFEANYQKYKGELEALDREIEASIASIPEKKRVLITSHDAFQYYGRRYGIALEPFMGTSTDAEAQTSDIVRLNKVIVENDLPAVFVESTVNPKLLEQLASDNDIVVGGELYADSIGDEDSPAPTYADMMRHNTRTIVEALKREKSEITEAELTEGEGGTNWMLYGLMGLILLAGFIFVARKMKV